MSPLRTDGGVGRATTCAPACSAAPHPAAAASETPSAINCRLVVSMKNPRCRRPLPVYQTWGRLSPHSSGGPTPYQERIVMAGTVERLLLDQLLGELFVGRSQARAHHAHEFLEDFVAQGGVL